MKILIATDGSEFSQAAIEKACDLITNPDETQVKLISVFSAPTVATEPFMSAPHYYEEISKSAKYLAEDYVRAARTTVESRLPQTTITEEVLMGSPGQSIVALAVEWSPDMIVVGSHGRGFWSRALLGSVSDAVVHHAPCSVLVVRSDGTGRH